MCSVRDENPLRERALLPAKIQGKKMPFWAPVDPKGGGTWWTVNSVGNILILLNGAFVNHLPNTRMYRKSRGLIVKELGQEIQLEAAWKQIDLEAIEPFTLVAKQSDRLTEYRWNGHTKFSKELNLDQACIWSSTTLYPLEIRRQRELLFQDFVSAPPSKALEIETFLFENSEPDNGFIMQRFETLRSLSVSIFDFNSDETELEIYYHDLLAEKKQSFLLELDHK